MNKLLIPALATDLFHLVIPQLDHAPVPEGKADKREGVDDLADLYPVSGVVKVGQAERI